MKKLISVFMILLFFCSSFPVYASEVNYVSEPISFSGSELIELTDGSDNPDVQEEYNKMMRSSGSSSVSMSSRAYYALMSYTTPAFTMATGLNADDVYEVQLSFNYSLTPSPTQSDTSLRFRNCHAAFASLLLNSYSNNTLPYSFSGTKTYYLSGSTIMASNTCLIRTFVTASNALSFTMNVNFNLTVDSIKLVSGDADAAYQQGYNAGNSAGYNSGYSAGYDAGNNAGYSNGYNTGYRIGYATGQADIDTDAIYNQGYTEGLQEGFQNGLSSVDTQSYYNSGYNAGVQAGKDSVDTQSYYNSGYNAGVQAGKDSVDTQAFYDSGYAAGYSAGTDAGYEAGYEAAYNDGYDDGYGSGWDDAMAAVDSWGADTSNYPLLVMSDSHGDYLYESYVANDFTFPYDLKLQQTWRSYDLKINPDHTYMVEIDFSGLDVYSTTSSVTGSKAYWESVDVFADIGGILYSLGSTNSVFYVPGNRMSNIFDVGVIINDLYAFLSSSDHGLTCCWKYDSLDFKIYDCGPSGNTQNHIANQTDQMMNTSPENEDAFKDANSSFNDTVSDAQDVEHSLTDQAFSDVGNAADEFFQQPTTDILAGAAFYSACVTGLYNNLGDFKYIVFACLMFIILRFIFRKVKAG